MLNDRKYRQIVNEWFARLEKGYAEPPYTRAELDILDEVKSKYNIHETVSLNESTADVFDEKIKSLFDGNIPAVQGNYAFPVDRINIAPQDKDNFEKLFFAKTGSDIGYGEIALFWLFNYKNPSNPTTYASAERAGASADLTINGRPAEIKSYDSHNKLIKLGVFESSHIIRKKLNSLFGVINLTSALTGEKTYFSELAFKFSDLQKAYEQILVVNAAFSTSEIQQVLAGSNSIFNEFTRQVKELIGNSNDPTELAKALIIDLAVERLKKKIGEQGGYLVNCLTGTPTDIKVFEIPADSRGLLMSKSAEEIAKNITVKSGNLYFNYNIFA
jgi:hypothetical protein